MGHQTRGWQAEAAHDGGHALTAIAIVLALLWCGVGGRPALLVATVAFPIMWEILDVIRWRMVGADGLHDLVTYQPVWVLYLVTHGQIVAGLVLAGGLVGFWVWYYRTFKMDRAA